MSHEHSAGAIIWRKRNNQLQYLLIQSQPYKQFKSAWAFSKGHLEKDETAQDAAKREIFEEVGLKPKFNFDFNESYTYSVTPDIQKTVTLFLAEYLDDQNIKLQESEIRQAKWFTYEEAQELLKAQNYDEFSFTDLIKILADANNYLQTH